MSVTLTSHIPALIARIEQRAERAVDDTLTDFGRALLEEFSEPKSGRVYKRQGRDHQASAPGEPPAIDEAQLIASFEFKKETAYRAVVSIGGTRAPYAVYLEYGTAHMAARPFWGKAIETVRPAYNERVRAILDDG